MKSAPVFSYWLLCILLLLPARGFAQDAGASDSSRIVLTRAAREMMMAAGSCALITLDAEGRPRVRTMDPFAPEEDFSLWFGTNPLSRKVKQIEHDPRVTLYYLDADASGYVMIHGTAQLVDDPEEKARHWKEGWEAFYPDREEGFLLIRVSPEWMEVLSISRGILGDTLSWEPPQVLFDKE